MCVTPLQLTLPFIVMVTTSLAVSYFFSAMVAPAAHVTSVALAVKALRMLKRTVKNTPPPPFIIC